MLAESSFAVEPTKRTVEMPRTFNAPRRLDSLGEFLELTKGDES